MVATGFLGIVASQPPQCNIDSSCIDWIREQVTDEIDYAEEFKNITGISVGAFIAIFIICCIVPNLVILLLIFLCCWCCKCGFFYRPKNAHHGYYHEQSGSLQSALQTKQESRAHGPPVPPKPAYSPGAPTPASGMWPWGEDRGQVQHRGLTNPGYSGPQKQY